MYSFYFTIEIALGLAWVVTWNLAAFWRAKATAQAPRGSYRLLIVFAALGLFMVFNNLPTFRFPKLWSVGPVLGWSMIALTAAGIAFMWWARFHLGKLWSGGVEVKHGHRVVDTGPYAWTRHPIYTGLILSAFAAAALRATPWAFLGATLVALGFALKARVEERFLEKEIGGYDVYRKRVPMIVPLLKFQGR
jgi:protein-S-isoprenylcysteine O-methyltransferase Ste14